MIWGINYEKANCVLISLLIFVNGCFPVCAEDCGISTASGQVYDLAYDLICDAISQNTHFNLSDIEGQNNIPL